MAAGRADSAGPATGTTVLTDWISAHGDELGRHYANELDRHFRTGTPKHGIAASADRRHGSESWSRAFRLLVITGQEGGEPVDRVVQYRHRSQEDNAQVIGRRQVEAAAMREQHVLLLQEIDHHLLVVADRVHGRVETREQVQRAGGLVAADTGHGGDLLPGMVTLVAQAALRARAGG